MARIRSNLRSSSRWGGAGAEYDTGYQYNLPDRKPIIFGPFKRIWPLGERNTPLDTLQQLQDAVIRDDVIYPIWFRQTTSVLDRTILAVDEFGLIPSLFHLEFYRANDAGDVIKVAYNDGTTSGVDASAVVSDGSSLTTAPWQKYVYFGNTTLVNIRRYSPVDHAFTVVAGTPNPKFLFFLDNNLVAIYKSGASWVMQWSVDSLPEDWAGAGSGQLVIPGSIGEVKGYGNLNDAAVIIGTRGAVIVAPTGSASPAFKMDNVDAIGGTPFECVTAVTDIVYYIDFQRRLSFFDGNRASPVGAGIPFFSSSPVFYNSKRVGLLMVSLIEDDRTYLLDTNTQEWVSVINTGYEFISDSPHSHIAGKVLCYININSDDDYLLTTLDLDPAIYTQPTLETGRIDLGTELYIDYVDVIRTSLVAPVPVLRVLRQLQEGTVEISSYTAAEAENLGTQVRYRVNAYAQMLEIQFGYPELEGPFLLAPLTAGGNLTSNPTNPSGYSRADLNPAGNYDVSLLAITYVGEDYDTAGNMIMSLANTVSDDIWLADTGVEYIKVMLQRESNEPSAIG